MTKKKVPTQLEIEAMALLSDAKGNFNQAIEAANSKGYTSGHQEFWEQVKETLWTMKRRL